MKLALFLIFFCAVSGQIVSQVSVTVIPSFSATRPANGFTTYCGGINQPVCPPSDPVPTQTRWGEPATSQKSGLGFDPVTRTVSLEEPFLLGKLVHFNFAVYDPADQTTLSLTIQLKNLGGTLIGSATFSFNLLIEETPNNVGSLQDCPYPSTIPCSDRITFANSFSPESFQVGDAEYTLQLLGFKEEENSQSSQRDEFISNENDQQEAFLFGRLTVACPPICANNAEYVVNEQGVCSCNCSTAPACTVGQNHDPNCQCTCHYPTPIVCQNGGTLQPNCQCNCQPCQPPKISDGGSTCGCKCDPNRCVFGVLNATDPNCGCICNQNIVCGENFIVNSTCQCDCLLTCPPERIRDPNTKVCRCICDPGQSCPQGYVKSPSDCSCQCNRNCPNGQELLLGNCTCGECTGNWTKDEQGLCTICGLQNSDCAIGLEEVDPFSCTCKCINVTCRLEDGLVPVPFPECGCRPCDAGRCICGNGRVEAGEQCDAPGDPCCGSDCRFTTDPCDDGNGCTIGDVCNGNGTCLSGNPKCRAPTECMSWTCVPSDAESDECTPIPVADKTPCGSQDLCQQRCIAGECTQFKVNCTSTEMCRGSTCNSATGDCDTFPLNGTQCNDGLRCTRTDVCIAGVCRGFNPVDCSGLAVSPCEVWLCDENELGRCRQIPINARACDADDNLCTQNDTCSAGVCLRGPFKSCQSDNRCVRSICIRSTGLCQETNLDGLDCNDGNICTTNDTCVNGTCVGVPDPSTATLERCGGDPPRTRDESNRPILIVSVAGASALVAAAAGTALLIKRVRDSKLTDPDTWNPDTFNSIEVNPMYKGLQTVVDNRLYEASN